MTLPVTLDPSSPSTSPDAAAPRRQRSNEALWRRALSSGRVLIGGGILLVIVLACLVTLPFTLDGTAAKESDDTAARLTAERGEDVKARATLYYAHPVGDNARQQPTSDSVPGWFGFDMLGRSILGRCLLGGAISLAIGFAAATIAVVLGVTIGLVAGYTGGWVDAGLMRFVDVMYGLPYILLVILFKVAFEDHLSNGNWLPALLLVAVDVILLSIVLRVTTITFRGGTRAAVVTISALVFVGLLVASWRPASNTWAWAADKGSMNSQLASLIILFLAIGLVSWLTMARVVRGQVLALREMPYIEACRALGLPRWRIFLKHVLPNLMGPIIVYATLTVPSAILQESFLSYLGVGVKLPLPTWGSLTSDGVAALSPVEPHWWMLTFPCLLLMTTLLSLNFLGDGLRDLFDPKREAAKI